MLQGGVRGLPGRWLTLMIGILLVSSLGFCGAASGAGVGGSYVFDPYLSLTGGCTTSEQDPVPDPGCPAGEHPPLGPFSSPRSITTDSYGNIYVANYGRTTVNGAEGRIDIFGPDGIFLTEIPDSAGPKNLAVDSAGNLYVFRHVPGVQAQIVRYSPSLYKPDSGEVEYSNPPVTLIDEMPSFVVGLGINPVNDHLFANLGTHIVEFDSAANNNALLDDSIGSDTLFAQGLGLAVDATRDRLYASDQRHAPPEDYVVRVFELASPHSLIQTIDGDEIPGGKFALEPSIAIDEESGDVFVYFKGESSSAVYRFNEDGTFVAAIEHDFEYVSGSEIAIDNGSQSPNKGYLFVPSKPGGVGQTYAFGPAVGCAPEVKGTTFGEVTEGEAELRAEINPCNLDTSYTFQYATRLSFQERGFAGAPSIGGQIPAGAVDADVSVAISGLIPNTEYVFRVVATNAEGDSEAEAGFTTYPANPLAPCPNDSLRTGASALLPDCRAYELVTPPGTNARAPVGVGKLATYFATRETSPAGDKVSFYIEGGLIPGSEGTGAFGGDPYLSTRGPDGWHTGLVGPNGAESVALLPGSFSPDQGYSFWSTGGAEGTAVVGGANTTYVRYPDDHSALIGRGSLGTDPQAEGKLISENGGHIIFRTTNDHHTPVKLEPNAPPTGTAAIYDRTADEVTHVVSLLPGDKTPARDAIYVGASLDGRGVAFEIEDTLYLRHDNAATYEIGEDVVFAGVAEGGARIFYLEDGRLYRFDAVTGARLLFASPANVIPVNVSADGSAAYLVSPSVLTLQPNPVGAKAKVGDQNLYLSREGSISFVGTVTERDVEGTTGTNDPVEGLGLWVTAVGSGSTGNAGRFGEDPSRTTPDGNVILFESRAALTGFDSEGHTQIYRYDFDQDELQCISCNPTGASANGFASLQSIIQDSGDPEPFSSYALVNNLRPDGRRAIFQSTEALVVADTDGLQDVYEWEAPGVGSCTEARGCVYLISSGHSARPDYLYAISDSGDDIFFRTSDLLWSSDQDETPSIYDARVGGGFPEPFAEEECQAEGCRAGLSQPPALPSARTPALGPHDNAHRRCPKGKRKVKRHGKVRCVTKHRKHKHHRKHKAGAKKKGASR
jgi:hypothetical protein